MLKVANSVISASRITGVLPVANGGTGVTTSTGTTAVVLSTSPTITTPTLAGATLSGTVAGGGNQINNVVIGTTSPLASSFTTVAASGTVAITPTVGTNSGAFRVNNTGGSTYIGVDNSAGNDYTTGVAYSSFVYTPTNFAVVIGNGLRAAVSSAGLAVIGAVSATTTIATGGYTVATLPAGTVGQRAYVTDAVAPVYNTALTGGGSVTISVFRNATIWVSA